MAEHDHIHLFLQGCPFQIIDASVYMIGVSMDDHHPVISDLCYDFRRKVQIVVVISSDHVYRTVYQ